MEKSGVQLRQCIKFIQPFPDKEIVYTLCRLLNYPYFRLVILKEDLVKRGLHVEMCKIEKSKIEVAEYLTKLPDLKFLEQKLHSTIKNVRNSLKVKI